MGQEFESVYRDGWDRDWMVYIGMAGPAEDKSGTGGREREETPGVGLVLLIQKASHIRLTFNNLHLLYYSASISRHVCPRATARYPEMLLRAHLLASATWMRSAMLVGRNVPRTAPLGSPDAEDDKPYLGIQRSSLTDLVAAKSRVHTPPLPCTSTTANHPFSCFGNSKVTTARYYYLRTIG